MKHKTNNTTTSIDKTIVRSYKELLQIIQQSIEQHNEIRLVDLLVTFKVDTYTLLGKKGIPIDSSTDTLFVDYPVFIEGLECKEVVLNKITFNKEVGFLLSLKSEIERLAIYDCNFNYTSAYSLRIEELICGEFDMIHCSSNSRHRWIESWWRKHATSSSSTLKTCPTSGAVRLYPLPS